MPLIPDVQPSTLQEIATAMAKVCWQRGYRIGWVRPVTYLSHAPVGIHYFPHASDRFPRDWMGRLVTDMPARLAEE